MGQYFLIVNHRKRQFIDPFYFPSSEKFPSILSGKPIQAAITLLVCSSNNPKWYELEDKSCKATQKLLGSWAGQAEIIGDYSEEDLSQKVRAEYEDISTQCLTMLFDLGLGGTEDVLENVAMADPYWLQYLETVVEQNDIPDNVKRALQRQFGTQWKTRFYEVFNRHR